MKDEVNFSQTGSQGGKYDEVHGGTPRYQGNGEIRVEEIRGKMPGNRLSFLCGSV
jgi:hypothetical protein